MPGLRVKASKGLMRALLVSDNMMETVGDYETHAADYSKVLDLNARVI